MEKCSDPHRGERGRREEEEEEGEGEREWKRDGIERVGGTKRMDDGCSLALALPSVHQGCKSLLQGREED